MNSFKPLSLQTTTKTCSRGSNKTMLHYMLLWLSLCNSGPSVLGFTQQYRASRITFSRGRRALPKKRVRSTVVLRADGSTTGTNGFSSFADEFLSDVPGFRSGPSILSTEEPDKIEFIRASAATNSSEATSTQQDNNLEEEQSVSYLRESAMYIADHRENTIVIHIPGEFIERNVFSNLLDDIALIWLLGLKIVLVVGGRFQHDCHGQSCGLSFKYPHEYHNSIHITDDKLLRNTQEEAGYVRFEVERMLNKSIRLQGGMTSSQNKNAPAPNGNVVSGNFYHAAQFGVVQGIDYKSTGYPKHVHVEKMQKILGKNDIILLTPIGTNRRTGELVSVNSYHLAAFCAASLRASKLIFLTSTASVLQSSVTEQRMLDIPLSCSKSLVQHHDVQVHDAGFVSFDKARKTLDEATVEKLLNLAWCNWALEHGVQRAHVVGPDDGALLEELFTAMDGTNTCVRQENDSQDLQNLFAEETDETTNLGPLPSFLRQSAP